MSTKVLKLPRTQGSTIDVITGNKHLQKGVKQELCSMFFQAMLKSLKNKMKTKIHAAITN